jgi:hypothetical protein
MRAAPQTGSETAALTVPQEAVAAVAHELDGLDGPTVGLWWEGSGNLHDPRPWLDAISGTPVILQTGAPRSVLETGTREWVDLTAAISDFQDLAAALCAVDMVVTADGPIAHLAAALGRPCFVLVGVDRPWFWSGAEGRPIWYPSARPLFQQPDGSWSAAHAALSRALAESPA